MLTSESRHAKKEKKNITFLVSPCTSDSVAANPEIRIQAPLSHLIGFVVNFVIQ